MKQRIRRTLITILLLQNLGIPLSSAQDEFGSDFTPPPPPPPLDFDSESAPADGGFPGSAPRGTMGRSGLTTSTSGKGEGGILNRNQKEKFAKSAIEDITDENFPETIESFDFPNADIQDIVKAISELTGKNFIIDNGLRGKITIIAPSKITVAEAYKAFLSALAINGFAIVPQGKFLKIRGSRNAQRDSIETYSGAYYPNSDQMITRIIHLKHISAEAVNRELRILNSKDGEIAIYAPTNSLIMSDYGSNIDRVMKILNQLDVPGFEDQLEVIPVKYAKSKDIADLIDKVVNKGQSNNSGRGSSGTFSAGVPRFSRPTGSQGSQGSASYMVIPDDRTNSLIVVGNKAGIARIKKLLTQLDFRIRPEDAGGVFVYYMKHGEAKKIAQTLQGIAKDAAPKPAAGAGSGPLGLQITSQGVQTSQEIFGGDVKITADEGTNSLVVVASKQDYETVLRLLNKIDIPRDQVYVEAIILEMKSTDAMNYQIGYFQFDKSGSGGKIGFNGFQGSSLQDLLSPAGGQGTILGFGSGDKVEIKSLTGGASTTVSSLLGFVQFLKTNANANILSTPQLMALDAQEASIEVGDSVVIGSKVTPGANGAPASVEPNFADATILLKVKPFISPTTNSIRMELKSNIKQLSIAKTPDAFLNSTQPLATRRLETNIVVRNGDTAVLGGLMKEDDVEKITKVPLLGDIPILGWLFKSRSSSKEKTNMLIFLTPKIIRTAQDSDQLLGQKLEQRQKYIKSIGGRDPYGETIDEIAKQRAAKNQNNDGDLK